MPFHIIVEEAHRYIQNDKDRFLIGYNIFERIAKEGRKYGAILGLISQRPVELSDTVISQCSNFLIFKMNHPIDVDYIRKMVPNINDEIVEKQKNLQAGTCLGFGAAFKIPMIIKMDMPDPAPWSGNCDVVTYWNGGQTGSDNISMSTSSPTNSFSGSLSLLSLDEDTSSDSAPELIKTLESLDVANGSFGLTKLSDSVSVENSDKNIDDANSISVGNGSGGFISTLSTDINKKAAITDTGVPLVSFLDSDELDDYQSIDNLSGNNLETNLLNSSMSDKQSSNVSQMQSLIGNITSNNNYADTNASIEANVTSAPAIEIPSFATSRMDDEEEDDDSKFVNAPTFAASSKLVDGPSINDRVADLSSEFSNSFNDKLEKSSVNKNDLPSIDLNSPMTSVESFIQLADGQQKSESDNFDSISPVDINIDFANNVNSFAPPDINLDKSNNFDSVSPVSINNEDADKVVVPLVSFID